MENKINRGVIRDGEANIKVYLIDGFLNHPYYVFDANIAIYFEKYILPLYKK